MLQGLIADLPDLTAAVPAAASTQPASETNAKKDAFPIQHIKAPARVMLPARPREFCPPEEVGYDKRNQYPTVKKPLHFECPDCRCKMKTHVLVPYMPTCPQCSKWLMNEVEK